MRFIPRSVMVVFVNALAILVLIAQLPHLFGVPWLVYPLVAVGERPPGFAQVHLTADAQERLGGPAWFDRTGADTRVGPLYALYREPGRHVVGALQRAAA